MTGFGEAWSKFQLSGSIAYFQNWILEITKAVFPNNRVPVGECFLGVGLENIQIIRERDLYDFEFKIIGVTIASGSYTLSCQYRHYRLLFGRSVDV